MSGWIQAAMQQNTIPSFQSGLGEEIKCTVHVTLLKRPINYFKLEQQIRQQALRVYCPIIYTVVLGMWCNTRRHTSIFLFILFYVFFQNSRNVKESIITHFLLCTFVNVETHIACNYVPMSLVPLRI